MQHKGGPFSVLIPGNRLHLVSSEEHWRDLNSTSLNLLSSHAWSNKRFQPKYTFGYEWPDQRQDDGMPVVRAIGCSKIALWDTVKRFASRMNILTMFGDDIGTCIPISLTETRGTYSQSANDPEFVDRGLRYIDEVALILEVAKIFPAFLVM
jgi:hypothetical protein